MKLPAMHCLGFVESSMFSTFHYDPANQGCELHINGVLKRSDLVAGEAEMATRINAERVRRYPFFRKPSARPTKSVLVC